MVGVSLSTLRTAVSVVAGVLAAVFYAERLGFVDVAVFIEGLGGRATETPGGGEA